MLHIVTKSSLFNKALSIAQKKDCLILIEDGIHATIPSKISDISLYVLQENAVIRDIPETINLVDYAGFVELVVQHSQTLTWY
jgi:sulfur relay protein TusB/DsrH